MLEKLKAHKPDLTMITFIALVVSLFFWKVVFLAKPISRICILGTRDVLFRQYFASVECGYDESLYLLLSPYYRLVAHYWRDLQLPLWNPYAGWGQPLLGDIQAMVFSPLVFLFSLNPTTSFFNILLVLEVFVAASGTYILSRHMKLDRCAALFASTSYAFCPYFLYFLELLPGKNAAFLPWIFWLFMRLSTGPSLKRAVICAFGCSVFIASGHPETSFIGVTFATLCMVINFALRKEALTGLRWTAIVASIALCLSAPVILPFLEFLLSSDCYKFAHAATVHPPVQAMILNLLQPMYWGASPYLGFLTLSLIALSFFVRGDKCNYVVAFLISSLAAFIGLCRPLFFGTLLDWTPASLVPGIYCAQVYLLQLAVLSAFGCGYFFDQLKVGKNKAFIVFLACLIITCFFPAVLNLCGFSFKSGNFDNGVKDMTFNSRVWLISLALSASVCFVFYLKSRNKIPQIVLCVVVIALSFCSQGLANRLSLPNQPVFDYDMNDPLPFLMKKGERVLPIGFDVLAPNTNEVFRIPAIGMHNVMQPARYKEFMASLGAKITTFNKVVDKLPLPKHVDYCGIRYVISLAPVYGEGDETPKPQEVDLKGGIYFEGSPEISLSYASVAYDNRKAEARGKLRFIISEGMESRFYFTPVVNDEKGTPVWFGGLMPVRKGRGRAEIKKTAADSDDVDLSALVPTKLKPGQKFYAGLQVVDSSNLKILKPITNQSGTTKIFGKVIVLSGYSFANPDLASNELHYRFVSESGPHHVRVYENTRTLGRAYLVFSSQLAASPEEALKVVSDKEFQGLSKVVLEGINHYPEQKMPVAREGISVPLGKVLPNRLEMDVTSPEAGYLVLTDTYFPGWKATLDGRPVEIVRANYLFRAVCVPKGAHHIVFSYEPTSFTIAILLFFAGAAVSVWLLWRGERP
ncbi:MAG: YfhO family protein [Candidatus Melainabacteria bacterium]|nr:YfhO family protein [Candidatus Melainabacteria bacterium]